MTFRTLIWRSLLYHFRDHLGVLAGAAISGAVLVGALVVGDSVRHSLREMALARLGKTHFALAGGDRLFRAILADELQAALATSIAPTLQLRGIAANQEGSTRANHVQVLGVEDRFWKLAASAPSFAALADDAVILNETLAAQLKVRKGDGILLRVDKPSELSRDAPLSPEEDASVALRLRVFAVVGDDAFGRFSLQASQLPPMSAFVSLQILQDRLKYPGRANLLLVGGGPTMARESLGVALAEHFQLPDADVEMRVLTNVNQLELRTARVFLDQPVVEAAMSSIPGGRTVLTYFVNQIRFGEKSTPYSMVTAAGPPLVPENMRDDEIVVGEWLAEDLGVKAGDPLALSYYVVGPSRHLEERTNRFRVHSVVPLGGLADDRDLMPPFPGMANAADCREWDTGFPVNLDAIRGKDQKYWEDRRGTPKAFVTPSAGQQMWTNRFGASTAVRWPLAAVKPDAAEAVLRKRINPASIGLVFQPVREQALAASDQALDFGQLFIGFSFFLIVAALILLSLLFQLGVERRSRETGTLLALGFQPRQVRRLLLGEGAGIALIGGAFGVAGGILYAQAMLHGLSTIWRGAVGTSALRYHAEPGTLAMGAILAALVAIFTVWLALRKQVRQSARELLAEGGEERVGAIENAGWLGLRARGLAMFSGLAGLALMGWGAANRQAAAGAFFGAGGLLLVAALSAAVVGMNRLGAAAAATALTPAGLGVRNSTRRRRRSLSTMAMLACGTFIVVAVGANKLDAVKDAAKRSSGTGGFALVGESSLPVIYDLNEAKGREFFGLVARAVEGLKVVPLRVRDGDDASCLNLNRAQKPRLLGVKPEMMSERGAFAFAGVAKGLGRENPWLLLNRSSGDGTVPAIADEASILWALGKSLGDTLDYVDERGNAFKVRLVGALANSILQGNIVVSENEFVARFPSEGGYRMFLLDAPSNRVSALSDAMTKALRDVGLELVPASERLAAFNAVQNTYLQTFQVLGGLGLLLGSVGLGVVVLRNVLERRAELALLAAVGWRRRLLQWLILSEHGALLLAGLACGAVAALVAVLPAVASPGADAPYGSLLVTLGAVLASGAVWTWGATRLALRGRLLDALRND